MKKITSITLWLVLMLSAVSCVQNVNENYVPSKDYDKCLPPRSSVKKYVYDYVGELTKEENDCLVAQMKALDDFNGSQIVIIITDELCGYSMKDYSVKVFNEWEIGQRNINNGLMIVVSPAMKEWRITTGFGTEKVLPDDKCLEIGMDSFSNRRDIYGKLNDVLSYVIPVMRASF